MSHYPEETIKTIVNAYYSGRSVQSLMEEYQIPRSTIYVWLSKAAKQDDKDNDKPIARVNYNNSLRRIAKLESRLRVLQEVDCSVHSPLQVKLKELARLYETGEYTVHALCDALKVDRGTFYNHILRNVGENNYNKRRREELKKVIFDIFHEYNQTLDSKRITQELKNRGINTTKEMVIELMREMDLQCIRGNAKRYYNKERREAKKRNLICRNFSPEAPNMIWAGDTSMIYCQGRRYQLCTVMDLFSRKILACKISRTANTHLVKSTFEKAYAERGRPCGLIFHSDQGSPYTSVTFENHLESIGVRQSFSLKGTPYDNAVQESFYKTLKEEELYR